MSYTINKNYPCSPLNYGELRSKSAIKYIVVHYTAGTAENGTAALANAKYFMTGGREASAHYFVDSGSIVYESVNPLRVAWSVGANYYKNDARNSNTLNVEICSYMENGKYGFREKAVATAAELVKNLMAEYNIGIDNVIRHYDVTGKICPEPYVRDIKAWQSFKARLTAGEKQPEKDFIYVTAYISGKKCTFTGFTENNENWIKATAALEAVGYTAKWHNTKKRVIAVKDGEEKLLDIRTYISQDSISFCPLRELFEYLGYKVSWNGETKKITVNKN